MRAARLLIVGLLLMSSRGFAFFYTGNQLVDWMRQYEKYDRGDSEANLAEATAYMAFITGVHDAADGLVVCSPEKSTVAQVTAIVTKYIKANPEQWNQPAHLIVLKALSTASPCKATKEAGAPSLGHGVSRAAPASV